MNPSAFDALWNGQRLAGCPLRMVGVRGALEDGKPNKNAIYDDLIFVVDENNGVTVWVASVDPSWALIQNPINSAGAAQLLPGVHLFEKHLMHGKYLCLGQAEDVHVNRLDQHGNVQGTDYGQFGICIHSGGSGTSTGRFSAGCQIIHNGDGYFGQPTWQRFIKPIFDSMAHNQLVTIPYMLVDAKDFRLPIPDPSTFQNPVT